MAGNATQRGDSNERASLIPPRSTDENDCERNHGGSSSNYGTVNDAEAALPIAQNEEQCQSSSLVTKVVGALFIGIALFNLISGMN